MGPKFRFILLSISLITPFKSSFGLTLEDSYKSALGVYQSDKINDSKQQQASEALSQGRSTYLPTLSGKGSYFNQDQAVTQKALGLNLTANLFNGGKDGDKIEILKVEEQIAKNTKKLDRLNLYTELVDAYYNYLLNLSEIKNLDLLKKQSSDRVNEIRKRVQIGRSRRGELLQAEAQLASVEAQSTNGMGLYRQAMEKLKLLTGLSETQMSEASLDPLTEVKSFEDYKRISLEREDLVNKKYEIEKYKRTLSISKNHYMPKLDLASNYFVYKDGSTTYKNADWDVGLTLTIPLFEGGSAQSQMRIDAEKKLTSEYQLTDLQRKVLVDLSSKYEAFKRYNEQVKPYDQAFDLARKSYEETLRDYRLGLVTNLDVLTALNLYLDRKRDLEKTRIQVILSKRQLEASAGILPE